MRLSTRTHDRDVAGYTYVYPVISRRARGVSLGINLNPNNACNWRCVYCQVPNLTFGKAPDCDLTLLERELTEMLEALVEGDYLERHVPADSRVVRDLAFSGNGEPTSSPQFAQAIELARRTLDRFAALRELPMVLISNGSLVHQSKVQEGLRALARGHGVLWFKLDSATDEGAERLNGQRQGIERTRTNLRLASELVATWLQTCVLERSGEPPSAAEQDAWLRFVEAELERGTTLQGVHLYGLARRSWQPEAPELAPLPIDWIERYAERIRALGLEVRVNP